MRMSKIEIFTDGACKGNPGVGGWGVLLRFGQNEKCLKGAVAHTTNNRMELMAAIEGLKALKTPSIVELCTDSQYLRQGMMQWLAGWKRNGWKTAQKTAVKNSDLWQELDALATIHNITWHWVRGHTGHVENELADRLANEAIAEFKSIISAPYKVE